MNKVERVETWDVIRYEATDVEYCVTMVFVEKHTSTWTEFVKWAKSNYEVVRQDKKRGWVVVR